MDPELLDLVYAAHVLLGFCVVLGCIALTIVCLIGSLARRSLYEIIDILSHIRSMMFEVWIERDGADVFGRKYKTTDVDQGESPVFDEDLTVVESPIADAASGSLGERG